MHEKRLKLMRSIKALALKATAPICVVLLVYAPRALTQNADADRPKTPFAQMKGRLTVPAQGRSVLAFGERTQAGYTSRGIAFETSPSARIVAPSDGWVVFAGERGRFGRVVTINAGGGYRLLFDGLGEIGVEVGQFVSARDPIGTMPAVEDPALYVEASKDEVPFDPAPWFEK